MIKAINAVLVHTRDVGRLARFYRDVVGVALKLSDHGGGLHAEADLGDVHFAIFPGGPAPSERGPITFAFHVDDVYAEVERLKGLGVSFDAPPKEMGFGGIIARFRDPDGNGVDLMMWKTRPRE